MKMNLCMGCMKERKEEKGACPYCGFDPDAYHPSLHHLPPGTILNGKYLIGKVLGEGGFGITYIGMDLNLELKLAVKEYYPTGLVTRSGNYNSSLTVLSGEKNQFYSKGMEHFLDEARRLGKFWDLPGVVSVRDFFQENNTVYFVMEFIEGKSFKELLQEKGEKLPVDQVLAMMRPVMESLEEIHASGMIHRDISPDNLMVTAKGQIKLIDFGSARSFSADAEKSLSVFLKPGYAPEEQYRSHGTQGPWTDIYALSATLYRAITGVVPDESLDRMEEDHLCSPAEYGITIKQSQEQAIMKGLSIYAKDRYQSVRELMDDLYAEGEGRGDLKEQNELKEKMKPEEPEKRKEPERRERREKPQIPQETMPNERPGAWEETILEERPKAWKEPRILEETVLERRPDVWEESQILEETVMERRPKAWEEPQILEETVLERRPDIWEEPQILEETVMERKPRVRNEKRNGNYTGDPSVWQIEAGTNRRNKKKKKSSSLAILLVSIALILVIAAFLIFMMKSIKTTESEVTEAAIEWENTSLADSAVIPDIFTEKDRNGGIL